MLFLHDKKGTLYVEVMSVCPGPSNSAYSFGKIVPKFGIIDSQPVA
jgi:hypothetical protein